MLVLPPVSAQTAQTGQISGVVQTDDGKALRNAPVECRVANYYVGDPKTKRPVRNPAYTFQSRRVVSDSSGQYTCPQLPDGPYYLCAFGTQANHLPSCLWNTVPERVIMVTGGKSEATNLIVKTGVLLRVRANDAKGRMSSATPALVAVNVGGFGYRGMQLVSRNPAQEVRELAIPRNVKIWIVSGKNFEFGGGITPTVNQQSASQQISLPNGLELHTIDLEAK